MNLPPEDKLKINRMIEGICTKNEVWWVSGKSWNVSNNIDFTDELTDAITSLLDKQKREIGEKIKETIEESIGIYQRSHTQGSHSDDPKNDDLCDCNEKEIKERTSALKTLKMKLESRGAITNLGI